MRALALMVLALAGTVLVSAPAAPAHACSCADLDATEAADSADLVFEGVVESAEPVGWSLPWLRSTGDPVRVRFAVERVTKGSTGATATVGTVASEASCGYEFEPGRRYRVYVARGETGSCSGNEDLGPGPVRRGHTAAGAVADSGVGPWAVAATVGTLVIGFGVLLVLRWRRVLRGAPATDA